MPGISHGVIEDLMKEEIWCILLPKENRKAHKGMDDKGKSHLEQAGMGRPHRIKPEIYNSSTFIQPHLQETVDTTRAWVWEMYKPVSWVGCRDVCVLRRSLSLYLRCWRRMNSPSPCRTPGRSWWQKYPSWSPSRSLWREPRWPKSEAVVKSFTVKRLILLIFNWSNLGLIIPGHLPLVALPRPRCLGHNSHRTSSWIHPMITLKYLLLIL